MKNRIKKCSQQGFTLIEMLIAMFVLSVGLLGVGAMLVQSINFNHTSNIRGQALFLATDMAERIRNNQPSDPANAHFYQGLTSNEVDPGCIATPSGYSSAQMREYDGYVWGQMLNQRLPGGSGTVSTTAIPDILAITITWDEQDDNAPDGMVQKRYVLEFLPNLANPGPLVPAAGP